MNDVSKSAVISDCGLYRYRLTRSWDATDNVVFVMLNPSTADAEVDDPTIRRCMNFAKSWGFGGIEVVNLFAWRATDPQELRLNGPGAVGKIVGPDNNKHIEAAVQAQASGRIVAAWGAHPWAAWRAREVRRLLSWPTMCLGHTKGGFPRHPLYVKADADVMPYSPAKERS